MNTIRNALILSDIHLGASSGLLTALDYTSEDDETLIERPHAKRMLQTLLAEVRRVSHGERIQQCILLGDIFEFSFAPYGLAMRNGHWFFHELAHSGLFEEFVFIPGNHDHHLWQQIVEHHYILKDLTNAPINPPQTLPAHETIKHTFMDQLLPEGYGFQVTYPNYAFSVDGERFYLHHGHYLQKLYVAASDLLAEAIQTQDIEDLETLNAPFLELGWYNLGQAYNVGTDKLIDRLYRMYKDHDTKQMDRLLHYFIEKMQRWANMPRRRDLNPIQRVSDAIIHWVGPFMIKRLFFKYGRQIKKRRQAMSTARHKRLSGSLSDAVLKYILKYLVPEGMHGCTKCFFIFGHTHEPEENVVYNDEQNVNYHVYNTGGWVADQLQEDGSYVLPHMAPLYIHTNGEITPLRLFETHADVIRTQLAEDPVFGRLAKAQAD